MTEIGVQRLESNFQVVHASSGRVRLRTPDSTLVSTLDTLAQKLRLQNGISEVRTNSSTKSLVVTFDESIITLPQMLEILREYGVSEAPKNTEPLSINKSLEASLKPAEIIPLVAGIAVTTGLGIQGWMAFPVYTIAEIATKQLMKQLDGNSALLSFTQSAKQAPDNPAEENSKFLSETEVSYRIVHQISGRIRFQIPRIASDSEYLYRLTVLAESDSRVTNVRVNTAASSIAISYDRELVADDEMQEHLINLIQSASDIILLPNLKAASIEESAESESNPWLNLTLPAISTALSLLAGPLGLPIPPLVVGGTIAISTLPVLQRTLHSILVEHRLNIDFLDLMAISITTLQGQFINPALMLLLIQIGETIREQTARSSQQQTLDLLDCLKQLVWVERNGEKQEIPVQEVQAGDTVIVYPGEQIPVDGQIIRGKALVDEQKLTGEAMPVMRKKGQVVFASTLVREGRLYILAEKVGADTRAGQIIKVMQDAPVHDTRIENYAAKVADAAVLPTLLLSGIVFAATRNVGRAAAILTLDLATGIRVSVPTTVLAALTLAARRGVLIRSGRALEKLAAVDAVVFDKTGTLTSGYPAIVSVETVSNSASSLRVLELAAAAEQRLTHPVAEAVVRYAQEKGAKILPRGKWEYEIGLGVRAEIEGELVLVGSDRFLRQAGINLDALQEKHEYLQAEGCSIIYVASNGELQGILAYRDPLRAESAEVIQILRSTQKMEIHLLTGDNKRIASGVAKELGIAQSNTHAEAFPEQKVAVVEQLREEGKTVAFVGDGINDSPALAYADVSVSFANGSDVARETADVVLMENNLHGLPEAIAIARQAMQIIHQNTGIVAIPNLAALALAATVGVPPLAATAINNGSAILAGLNGLRPLLNNGEDLDLLTADLDCDRQEPESENIPDLAEFVNGNGHGKKPIEEIVENLVQTLERNGDRKSVVSEPTNGKEVVALVPLKYVSNGICLEPLATTTELAPTNSNGKTSIQVKEKEILTPPIEVKTINGSSLAKRLNVSASTISKRKLASDFPEWSRRKDPDGIAWKYSPETKQFLAR
ncbi:MAG TPA: heavy metal translocating P-type ATPase [Leptolyngbyaceae cyanobacterium]